MRFKIVSDEDIKNGIVTDKYFIWTEKVLKAKNVNPTVVAEVTTSGWGVFAGVRMPSTCWKVCQLTFTQCQKAVFSSPTNP